jgi:hypothetical protein
MLPATTVFYSAQTSLRMCPWFPPFANCARDGGTRIVVTINGWIRQHHGLQGVSPALKPPRNTERARSRRAASIQRCNLTGLCRLGGAFQQKESEIGGQRLGTQPPNHRSDLAPMIRGVVGQMLHEVR